MAVLSVLACAATLLALACLGVVTGRTRLGSTIVYGGCLGASAIAGTVALEKLFADPGSSSIASLPIGLPWLGAHFRIDALAAFFLIVIDLGAAVASLFALGYGKHEHASARVLPFYPAFLAGMNLVLIADDAFSSAISVLR